MRGIPALKEAEKAIKDICASEQCEKEDVFKQVNEILKNEKSLDRLRPVEFSKLIDQMQKAQQIIIRDNIIRVP